MARAIERYISSLLSYDGQNLQLVSAASRIKDTSAAMASWSVIYCSGKFETAARLQIYWKRTADKERIRVAYVTYKCRTDLSTVAFLLRSFHLNPCVGRAAPWHIRWVMALSVAHTHLHVRRLPVLLRCYRRHRCLRTNDVLYYAVF